MRKSKQNVILDLDNTLLSAEAIEDFPFTQAGIKEKALQFDIHNMDGYYIVFERPGVQEFLTHLFETYNVSVWTAATKDYALYVVKQILLRNDPKRTLDHILFAYHCDISRELYKCPKNLNLIFNVFRIPGYTPRNTIIIDDLEEIHECQPSQSIRIYPFEILDEGSEYDDELNKVQREIPIKFTRQASHGKESATMEPAPSPDE